MTGIPHRYLSTGCLHGRHDYCQSMTGYQGEKRPGQCKFCEARCSCFCHGAAPSSSDYWEHPVIYMSRVTACEVWQLLYGVDPDLTGDLRFGQGQIPVLFDDRMALGEARLEEDPDPPRI